MIARVPGLPVLDWHYLGRTAIARPVDAVFDAPYRLWTTSGRAAIAIALMNAGLQRGGTVLLPTYHCPTMVSPARHLGLDVEFFPLAQGGGPDLDFVAARLSAGRVHAMLVAHYFGFPQSMRAVRELCDRHEVTLIEDCAHAMFGVADGKPVGSWGDYAIGSLTKFLPVSWGGCLASYRHPIENHLRYEAPLVQRMKKRLDAIEFAARHGRPIGVASGLRLLFDAKNFLRRNPRHGPSLEPTTLPAADSELFRFDEASALTAPSQHIARVAGNVDRPSIVERRRRIYERLVRLVAPVPGMDILHRTLPATVAPYVFPILAEHPDEVFRRARHSGIPVFRWNWLWPDTPEYNGDVGRIWSRKLLQLPCHQDLTDTDIQRIAQAIAPAELRP
jgi:dTDP-4-amino-4,6-dideoxygalactose transaminase